jgi:hypothetical protein
MADLQRKTKLTLDEVRMLILGSHILLGFQFNAAFHPGFDKLPAYGRTVNGVALVLMLAAIALLILPSVRHRIVEEGRDSRAFLGFASRAAGCALLPFAMTLGLDLYILGQAIYGTEVGIIVGAVTGVLALASWYGVEVLRRWQLGCTETYDMAEKQSKATPVGTRIEQMLTEARVILPGAQALFGFQLVCVLSEAFEKLPAASKLVHALSAGSVAVAVMLLMAPAAIHRIVWRGEDSETFHRTGSILVTVATLPLALGLAGGAYVVIAKIAQSAAVGAAAATAMLAALIGLWHVYPYYLRREREAGKGAVARHSAAE